MDKLKLLILIVLMGSVCAAEKNLVTNGDFEDLHDNGRPVDWQVTDACSIKEENGNHYLFVTPVEKQLVWAEQVMNLLPRWSRVKLSTRIKAEGLVPGDASWQVARVGGAFVDADNKVLGYIAVNLNKDSDWTKLSSEADVPEGATRLRLNPGNFGKDGDVSFDDITVLVTKVDEAAKLVGGTYYVDDLAANGDGSRDKPFNSIQAAADVAKAGDTVIINGGTYRESVRPANSGKYGAPITYKAADGETATISGAELVTGKWTQVPGKKSVWQVPITGQFDSVLNQAEQLFVDGRMMVEARFPNIPFDSIDPLRPKQMFIEGRIKEHGPSDDIPDSYLITMYDKEMTAPEGTYDGAMMYYWPRHGNGDQGGGWGFCRPAWVIKQKRGELLVNLKKTDNLKWYHKHHMLDGGEPYILLMHEACLDSPGEWLRRDNTLLFVPPKGVNPNEATIEIKRRDYAFNLTARSYTRIQGLKVTAATITTDHDSGNYGRGFTTDRGRKDVASAHHIELDRIHFKYVNHFTDFTGWSMGQWVQTSGVVVSGRDHKITNCMVEYTAGNGILVLGDRNLVHNNIIHDTNYAGSFVGGICMGMESTNRDTIVSHNTVWASGNDGIMAQRLWSTRRSKPARVHHNRVSQFGMLTRDVGGIKVVGYQKEVNGTRWDHNYVSDGGPWTLALYQDFSGEHVIDHNVAWNAQVALNINSGKGHHVFNNTLLSYKRGITGGSGYREKIINNLISSRYSLKYMNLKESDLSNNIESVTKSMFASPIHLDWRPKADSRAIDAGIPVDGVTPEGVDKPDCGAYQQDEDLWSVGSTLPHPTKAPTELELARNSNGQPVLRWKDDADNEQAYFVERALRPTPKAYWRLWEVIARLPANSRSWTDASTEALVNSPCYRVRADHSMLSNTVEVSAPGLVARWDFEQQLNDSVTTPVTRNGKISAGQPTFSDDAKSGAKSILFKDRNKQYIEIPDGPGLTPGDAITVMCWIKSTRWPGGNRVVFRKGTHRNMAYGMYAHGGSFRFSVGNRTAKMEEKPKEDEWIHLAGTFDGVRIRLYLNGERIDEQFERWGNSQGIPQIDAPLCIGGPSGSAGSNSFFNGMIDDFRLYADVEMTQKQIAEIVANGKPVATDNPVR